MQARWGKEQGVMSSLEQTSRGMCMGPEAALFEQLNCCILDVPLFSSLGGKEKFGSRKQICKEELHSNKPLSDNISLLYPPCNSEVSQKPD